MSRAQSQNGPVFDAFQALPEAPRHSLLAVRGRIFELAQSDPRVGPVEEALRWGEPAYLSPMGSPVRLGVEKTTGRPAVFFNCNTTLVEGFRAQFGGALEYVKNRAVLLGAETDAGATKGTETGAAAAVDLCIMAALTYHLRA